MTPAKASGAANLLRLADRVSLACSGIALGASGLVILAIVAMGAVDVIMGFTVNYPLPAATNVAEEALPAAVFLAAGMVLRNRANIVVDVLCDHFRSRLRRISAVIAALGTVVFFALLASGAWHLAIDSIGLNERAVAAVEFPIWPMKLGFAIGATIATFEALRLLAIAALSSPSHQVEGQDT